METKNFKLIISYDGTNYHGWQIQNDCASIQGQLERALSSIFNKEIRVRFSSRTDAGVHAFYQVVSFKTETAIKEENVLRALNSLLPDDIVVKSIEIVPESFDARKAIKKTYKYWIKKVSQKDPFFFNKAWLVSYKLDVGAMYKASRFLLGNQDFSSFMSQGSIVKTTFRTILDINITVCSDDIIIHITADGFLKQMVRNIVGTLVDVGRGHISSDKIKEIMDAKDRKVAGITAPACGLYLEKVFYE